MSEQLEELKKRLYKKEESFEGRFERPELAPRLEKPPQSWHDENSPMQVPAKSSTKKFWWAVLVLSAVAAAGAGFYLFVIYNSVYASKISIQILAPESAIGGERMTWEVEVINNNKKALEAADFIFEYPAGSKVLDEGVRALRARKILGRIEAGGSVRLSFSALVFGFESEEKEAHSILEYRAEGSSAILSKESVSNFIISRAPVGISFELPQEVRVGQDTEVKINYVSNSASALENLVLEFSPPPGFVYKSSVPEPEAGGRDWRLPALDPGERGTITVKGIMSGGEFEEKSFKARVGVRDALGEFSVYGQGAGTLVLRRPFLEVDAKIKGQDSYVARPGEIIDIEVAFKNNMTVPVENVVVEGTLLGKGFDEKQIRVINGSYRAVDKKIIFNASSADILKQINPGDEGILRFQFAVLQKLTIKTSADKEFKPSVRFMIRPGVFPPGFSGTDVTGEDMMEVKIASHLQLVRKGFYFSSRMPNTGPLPPKVGKETTFTITWSLTNSTNNLQGVIVRAELPAYMTWKEKVLPALAPISYDINTGELVWNVGELKAGVGYISPAKEVTFQLGFIPSQAQIGQTPEFVSEVVSEGRDTFTDTILRTSAPAQTLGLENDTKVDLRHTTVVK